MLENFRNRRLPLLVLAALLCAGSADLCQYGIEPGHDFDSTLPADSPLANASDADLECACAGHHGDDAQDHADHCASCPCQCHVPGILGGPEFLAGLRPGSGLIADADSRIPAGFHPVIERPPLFA
jgi:hypothetical protein